MTKISSTDIPPFSLDKPFDRLAVSGSIITAYRPHILLAPPKRIRSAPTDTGFHPLKFIGQIIIWLFSLFNIFLLYWLFTATFKTPSEIFGNPLSLPYKLFVHGHPWRNWYAAWETSGFARAFLNSLLILVMVSAVTLALAVPAAYALSRIQVKFASHLTIFIALGMGIPLQTIVIPLFIAFGHIGLVDSLWGLGITYVAISLPFSIFLLTGYFQTLPEEIEESASVEGASIWCIFLRIVLPLVRGGIITVIIVNAIGLWNETILSVVLVHDQSRFTLARALWSFYSTVTYSSDYGALLAGVGLLVFPMIVLYIFLAHRIIDGLTLGSGK